jgi:hypothetical protein
MGRYQRACTQAAVQLSVALILLLCGSAITKLQSTDRMNSTRITWETPTLLYAAAGSGPATLYQSNPTLVQPPLLFNVSGLISALQVTGVDLAAAAEQTGGPLLNASTITATYRACIEDLPGNCTSAVKAAVGSDLLMSFSRFIAWNRTADYLLKEGSVSPPTNSCLRLEKGIQP